MGPALVYTASNALTSAIPFFLLPLLTRVLSPAEYGTVTMFNVLISVLAAFTGLSVHGVVGIRYFERDKVDFPRYVATCLLLLAISTAAMLGIVLAAAPVLETFIMLPLGWMATAVLVSGTQFVYQIRLVIWQSEGKPWNYGALQVVQSSLNAGISLWLVLGVGLAWQGRILGQVGAALACFVISLWSLKTAGMIRFPADKAYGRDALKFGLPLIPHTIGGLVIFSFDRFLLAKLLGTESVGKYSVAFQMSMVLSLVIDSFIKAYHPHLIQMVKQPGYDKRKVVLFTYKAGGVLVLLTIAVIAVIHFGFPYFVGHEFLEALPLVPIICLGFMAQGIYFLTAIFLSIANRNDLLATNSIIAGVFTIGVSYFFINSMGLAGAAYGFLLGSLASFLLNSIAAQRVMPLPWFGSKA